MNELRSFLTAQTNDGILKGLTIEPGGTKPSLLYGDVSKRHVCPCEFQTSLCAQHRNTTRLNDRVDYHTWRGIGARPVWPGVQAIDPDVPVSCSQQVGSA